MSYRNGGNIGFDHKEIDYIKSSLNLDEENVYYSFIKKAGKKSNSLNIHFKSVKEFLKLQKSFINNFKSEINLESNPKNFCCFFVEKDIFGNELFHFINISNPNIPIVYYISNGTVPLTGELRDDRRKRIGLVETHENFIEFINRKTINRFGETLVKKVFSYLLLIFSPIIIIVTLIDKYIIQKIKKNYS